MSERTFAFNIIINQLFKLFSSSIFPLFNYTETTIYKTTILLIAIILRLTLLHKLNHYTSPFPYRIPNPLGIPACKLPYGQYLSGGTVEQELGATSFLLFIPTRPKPTLIIFIFLSFFFLMDFQSVTTSSGPFLIPFRILVKIRAKLVSFPLVTRLIAREEVRTVTKVPAV
jgi:hypothetical protein